MLTNALAYFRGDKEEQKVFKPEFLLRQAALGEPATGSECRKVHGSVRCRGPEVNVKKLSVLLCFRCSGK